MSVQENTIIQLKKHGQLFQLSLNGIDYGAVQLTDKINIL